MTETGSDVSRAIEAAAETGMMRALERSARALIGWLPPDEAVLIQAGRQMAHPDANEFAARARAARNVVEARPRGLDQSDLLSPLPDTLNEHVERLRSHPAGQAMLGDRWELATADLTRVASIQPSVFSDHAEERVQDVDIESSEELARVTLPVPDAKQDLPAQYDHVRQTWMLASANPNLRILGNWGGEIQPGVIGFGFAVQLSPSFLQVGVFRVATSSVTATTEPMAS